VKKMTNRSIRPGSRPAPSTPTKDVLSLRVRTTEQLLLNFPKNYWSTFFSICEEPSSASLSAYDLCIFLFLEDAEFIAGRDSGTRIFLS
jgi:hypothetical protein